jgi:predicted Zn-dependent peptidase
MKTPQVQNQNRLVVVNDNKARQNQVYFMLQGQNYTHENDVVSHLMDQYMGGDFSGLILQEIREFRSLAYSAGGRWVRPIKEGNPIIFRSYVGCQADKTNEAINVMMDLFNNMPQFTDRIVPFQQYLKAAACTAYPSPRDLTETIENLQLRGYNYDPSFLDFMNADKVGFAEMYKFYQANMQGHPVTVTIYGDLSKVDMEALKKIFPIVEEKKVKDIANY